MSEPTDEAILRALQQVIDPEVGINIVDLGLVYGTTVRDGRVEVAMTMTSPACPLGEYLRDEVTVEVARVEGVTGVRVDLVWEPAWSPARMSAGARRELGWSESDAAGAGPPDR